MKFRKKPVVIDAYQLTREVADRAVLDHEMPPGIILGSARFHPERRQVYEAAFTCVTIHGQITAVAIDDWIIAEPDGEHFYPCKPDIFAATYEPVNEPETDT